MKIEQILTSEAKPKEKVSMLTNEIKKDNKFIDEIINYFDSASTGEQGHLIESLEYISKDQPDLVVPYVDFVIAHMGDKAPRVKWECARIIANLALKFPDKAQKAIQNLLKNTNDKGTVVRWSSAFALGELAKGNVGKRKELTAKCKKLSEAEQNNGVRNVYLKALKEIEKL